MVPECLKRWVIGLSISIPSFKKIFMSLKALAHIDLVLIVVTQPLMFVPFSVHYVQKLQEVAFPRKDQLKRLLHEKYSKEHSEYLKSQVNSTEYFSFTADQMTC